MKIRYVVRDARTYRVDPEWAAERFDLPYYRGLLDKAWKEISYAFRWEGHDTCREWKAQKELVLPQDSRNRWIVCRMYAETGIYRLFSYPVVIAVTAMTIWYLSEYHVPEITENKFWGWTMEMRIGGKEVSSPDDAWIEVKNPATGELIDRVPAGSAGDVAEAVTAAGEAFDELEKEGDARAGNDPVPCSRKGAGAAQGSGPAPDHGAGKTAP